MADLTPTSALARRLATPERSLTLDALAADWFVQSIEARMPLLGALAGRTDVLPRVRGAWGRRLMVGASAEALAGKPCPFDPPCALDVFFREQGRQGGHGLSKPYVLEADRDGPDLIVRLKVFGIASTWTSTAADRLVEALTDHVDWKALGGPAGKRRVVDLKVGTVHGVDLRPTPTSCRLRLLTPVDDDRATLREEPWGLVARIATRVSSMARWHDADLDVSWDGLSRTWKDLDYDLSSCFSGSVGRASRGRIFTENTLQGDALIHGDLAPVWPLLVLGETLGVGRGAVHGLGRVQLLP